jgi:hypothetical protein
VVTSSTSATVERLQAEIARCRDAQRVDAADLDAVAAWTPEARVTYARLLRELALAHYESGITREDTVARLDELSARCEPLTRDGNPTATANRVWIERYAILARTDLTWTWAPSGGVAWQPGALSRLREADARLGALDALVRDAPGAATPAARDHLASAMLSMHWVLTRPACPLGDRAAACVAGLARLVTFDEPGVDRAWAGVESDRAMALAAAGDREAVEAIFAEVLAIYRARDSVGVRRALGKVLAAMGAFEAHQVAAIRRLAALVTFFEDEELARFFALRTRAVAVERGTRGEWAEAEALASVMRAVCAARPAPLLLRQTAEALADLGAMAPQDVAGRMALHLRRHVAAHPGERAARASAKRLREALRTRELTVAARVPPGPEAALPWPTVTAARSDSGRLALVDDAGLEVFLPAGCVACAWDAARGRVASLRGGPGGFYIDGYVWRGVPRREPPADFTVALPESLPSARAERAALSLDDAGALVFRWTADDVATVPLPWAPPATGAPAPGRRARAPRTE